MSVHNLFHVRMTRHTKEGRQFNRDVKCEAVLGNGHEPFFQVFISSAVGNGHNRKTFMDQAAMLSFVNSHVRDWKMQGFAGNVVGKHCELLEV